MAKINDTTIYPVTLPEPSDLLIGTDLSDVVNDPNGESVNFSISAILAVQHDHAISDVTGLQGVLDSLSGQAYTKFSFTATASQTTFSATYTVGVVDVFMNGVKLANSDFVATDGTSVVLAVGAAVDDVIEILTWSTFSVANAANLGGASGQDFSADNLFVTTSVDFGNWTITETSGALYFATGGTNRMKLDVSGNLTVSGELNANAAIT